MQLLLMAALFQAAAPAPPTLSAPAAAPPQVAAAPADRLAKLDALLAKRDYRALSALVDAAATPQVFMTTLEWLRDRSVAGSSALVSILYARDLIRAHDGQGGKTNLLQTAGLALLLAEAVIRSDGAHCADQTAVGNRLTQLRALAPRPIAALQAMPEAERQRVLEIVLLVAARTTDGRPADGDAPFVCTGGLSGMLQGLASGVIKEVPNAPGTFGKTYAVGDGKAVPETVAPEVWRERQAKLRTELPVFLREALKLPPAP